jgi:hypothetical protein
MSGRDLNTPLCYNFSLFTQPMNDISAITLVNVVDVSASWVSSSPAGCTAQLPHLARQTPWPAIIAWVMLKVGSNPMVHFSECRIPATSNVAFFKLFGSGAFTSIPTMSQVFPRCLRFATLGVECRCTLLANPSNQLNVLQLRAVLWCPNDLPIFFLKHLLHS